MLSSKNGVYLSGDSNSSHLSHFLRRLSERVAALEGIVFKALVVRENKGELSNLKVEIGQFHLEKGS
jgi:hypothetical protein